MFYIIMDIELQKLQVFMQKADIAGRGKRMSYYFCASHRPCVIVICYGVDDNDLF